MNERGHRIALLVAEMFRAAVLVTLEADLSGCGGDEPVASERSPDASAGDAAQPPIVGCWVPLPPDLGGETAPEQSRTTP